MKFPAYSQLAGKSPPSPGSTMHLGKNDDRLLLPVPRAPAYAAGNGGWSSRSTRRARSACRTAVRATSACATSSSDGIRWQGAGQGGSPVTSSMENDNLRTGPPLKHGRAGIVEPIRRSAVQLPLSQSGLALKPFRQCDKDAVRICRPRSRDARRSPAKRGLPAEFSNVHGHEYPPVNTVE